MIWRHWLGLGFATAQLQFEAQRVIALRMAKLAAGGAAAQAEALRMVSEKSAAAAEAAMIVATGGTPKKVIRRYRTRVRANARRLAR
jgi:hypothetical protein